MNGGTLDVVVAGAGRVGRRAVRVVDEYGHSVTVIERDAEICRRVADDYVATVIEGDATQPGILEQAGVHDADVVAALTGSGGLNLGICTLALRMAEDVRTVLRVDQDDANGYGDVVDEVIYPEGLGGVGAANAIIGGDVRALEEVAGDLRLLEIRVTEGAPVAGRTLSEVSLPRGSLVVSDESIDRISGPDTELQPGKTYVVATETDVADEVMQLFQG